MKITTEHFVLIERTIVCENRLEALKFHQRTALTKKWKNWIIRLSPRKKFTYYAERKLQIPND